MAVDDIERHSYKPEQSLPCKNMNHKNIKRYIIHSLPISIFYLANKFYLLLFFNLAYLMSF